MKRSRRHTLMFATICTLFVLGTATASLACASGSGSKTALSIDAPAAKPADISGSGSSSSSSSSKSSAGSGGQQAAAPKDSGQQASASSLQSVLDRKIVQSSSVEVGVKEVGGSFQEIIRLATTAGGFVASSSLSNADDKQVADLTIRVPETQYQDVLGKIRALGDVKTETSDANDVTEQYTDQQARLRTLQATEQRYLDLLAQATTINDILTMQDRLDGVRGQIEQLQGKINLLDELTNLATITVHLRPLGTGTGSSDGGIHPLGAAKQAWEYSLNTLVALGATALVIAAFSWWLVPPLAVLAFFARWWVNRRPRPATP